MILISFAGIFHTCSLGYCCLLAPIGPNRRYRPISAQLAPAPIGPSPLSGPYRARPNRLPPLSALDPVGPIVVPTIDHSFDDG